MDKKFNVHVLDTLKVSYERLQGCIDHEGALSLDEGTLATVIAMDRAGEMMRIDTIAEVSIALSRLSHGSFDFWESKKQELSSLAAALPAFHAICVCESNFAKYTEEKEKGNNIGNALESYLAAFEEVPKSVGCLKNNSSKARELLPKIHAYGNTRIELILCVVAGSNKECQAMKQTIESLLVDLAPYLKDASKLLELVDYPGKEPLMQDSRI